MNIKVAGVAGEAHELTADVAILVQLSALGDAQARLARERDTLLAGVGSRGQRVGQTIDPAGADLHPLDNADFSSRLEALAKEQAAADERARRLSVGLSPSARRIYASLSTARRAPFVVTLRGDCCSGCNMRLPSAFLGDIRRVRRLHLCPFCKRVLSPSALEA